MTKAVTLIHSLDVTPEVLLAPSPYAPKETIYIILGNEHPSVHLTSINQIKAESERLIQRYENVLKGLKYWQNKANLVKSNQI